MKVKKKSAIATVMDIIISGINKKKDIDIICKEAKGWIDTVRSTQEEVFGEPLTLEITEEHVRNAIQWIHKHKN